MLGKRIALDLATVLMFIAVTTPAFAACVWLLPAANWVGEWGVLLVPALAFVFLPIVFLSAAVLRLCFGRLVPGEYTFGKDAMAMRWGLYFALERVLNIGLWRELVFSVSALRWMHVRALGGRVAYDLTNASTLRLTDAALLTVERGAMLSAFNVIAGHSMEGTRLFLQGCTLGENVQLMEDVRMGPGTEIGANTVIGPESRLVGRTKIGPNCHFGYQVMIASGVTIGAECVVKHRARLEANVVLEDGAVVQAEARVPQGTRVAKGTRYPPRE